MSNAASATDAVPDVDLEDILQAASSSAVLGLLWVGYRTGVRWMWRNRKDADLKIEKKAKPVAEEFGRMKREIEESFKRDLRP